MQTLQTGAAVSHDLLQRLGFCEAAGEEAAAPAPSERLYLR